MKWNKDEMKQMDRKTRKIMCMYGPLRPRADLDRRGLPVKEEGEGVGD